MPTLLSNRPDRAGCPLIAGSLILLGVTLATVVVPFVPGGCEGLQWSRGDGLGVTWLTCHLCHWSWDHLAWDLFAFVLLSLLTLRLCPSIYGPCLLVAGLLIVWEVQWNQVALGSYRGLSGIDCALLGLVVASLWRSGSGNGRLSVARLLALLAAAGFIAKTGYELLSGSTVFVESGPQAFVPVPSAHLIGFGVGVVMGLLKRRPMMESYGALKPRQSPRCRPSF